VPRARQASFEPQLIARYRHRIPNFDAKVISLNACGLSGTRDRRPFARPYGNDVSPERISTSPKMAKWPLEPLCALVLFDALRVKVRNEGTGRYKAVYVVLGVRPDSPKETLGCGSNRPKAKF
jgi:putative transposase